MKVPFTNTAATFVHIGTVTIAPGHTRDVEETHIPGYQDSQQPPEPGITDPLAVLLSGKVPDVVKAIPSLSTADLERLGELEQTGQNRKGILSAIAEDLLNRANKTTQDVIAGLPQLDDVALAKLAEEEQAKGDLVNPILVAIAEEVMKRAIAKLKDLSDEELDALDKSEQAKSDQANAELVAAILAEQTKRKG